MRTLEQIKALNLVLRPEFFKIEGFTIKPDASYYAEISHSNDVVALYEVSQDDKVCKIFDKNEVAITYPIGKYAIIKLFLQNYKVKFFQQYFKNSALAEKLEPEASEFLHILGINDEDLKAELIKEGIKHGTKN